MRAEAELRQPMRARSDHRGDKIGRTFPLELQCAWQNFSLLAGNANGATTPLEAGLGERLAGRRRPSTRPFPATEGSTTWADSAASPQQAGGSKSRSKPSDTPLFPMTCCANTERVLAG